MSSHIFKFNFTTSGHNHFKQPNITYFVGVTRNEVETQKTIEIAMIRIIQSSSSSLRHPQLFRSRSKNINISKAELLNNNEINPKIYTYTRLDMNFKLLFNISHKTFCYTQVTKRSTRHWLLDSKALQLPLLPTTLQVRFSFVNCVNS